MFRGQVSNPNILYRGQNPIAPVRSGTKPTKPHIVCGPMKTKLSKPKPTRTRKIRSTLPSFVFILTPVQCNEQLMSQLCRAFEISPGHIRDKLSLQADNLSHDQIETHSANRNTQVPFSVLLWFWKMACINVYLD